ncbi:hypothetical protein FVE85_0433 [Porphyridium purpureum]|uniref:Cytochrome b-c1 complex subunit 8 n=1 Tax=Porphyridium purpureum TaxID=35688 RepID=A0A5J4Z1A4_PORPP|nr:hypothetical protein FVE85_0433 [Porphyridium purpureum]|eukprot:POR6278..scf208_2
MGERRAEGRVAETGKGREQEGEREKFCVEEKGVKGGVGKGVPGRMPAIKKLPKVRGVVTYSISPYEQRPFADVFDTQFMMTKLRRKITENWEWIPNFLILAGVISYAKAENKREKDSHRF